MTPPTVFVCVHITSTSHSACRVRVCTFAQVYIMHFSSYIHIYYMTGLSREGEQNKRDQDAERERETQNELLDWNLTPTTKWLLTQAVDWFLTQLWTYLWSWLHIDPRHMLIPSPGHRITFDPSPETNLWLWPPRSLTPIHWHPTLSGIGIFWFQLVNSAWVGQHIWSVFPSSLPWKWGESS